MELTNWQTFGKNVVLLMMSVIVFRYPRMMPRFVSERNQWTISLYSIFFGLILSGFCLYYLPVFDFRPYHIGANIPEGMQVPEGAEEPEYRTTFILEKNGTKKEFTVEDYPEDTAWHFVDSKTELVKEGFVVMPYINADPVLCKRLEEVGTACVMPLGAPIGSNRGLKTRDLLRIVIEQSNVPVGVDAGIGAPSHAAEAMEMGADAVLINTAIAVAKDPVNMAMAFKMAVEAGRMAFEAQLAPQNLAASATSPLNPFLEGIKDLQL